jgi:hypothetical protein
MNIDKKPNTCEIKIFGFVGEQISNINEYKDRNLGEI